MRLDFFKLGIAFILLALMFPLVALVDKYVDTGTALVTLILWIIGFLLILLSAVFTTLKQKQ